MNRIVNTKSVHAELHHFDDPPESIMMNNKDEIFNTRIGCDTVNILINLHDSIYLLDKIESTANINQPIQYIFGFLLP